MLLSRCYALRACNRYQGHGQNQDPNQAPQKGIGPLVASVSTSIVFHTFFLPEPGQLGKMQSQQTAKESEGVAN